MTGVALHERPAELLQRLIRFDTTNPPGNERACIEWIAGLLEGTRCSLRIVARDPERPNLIARLRGEGRAPGLLLQGHVDVVPASGNWSRPPFAGEIADGYVRGRGALDMKGRVAMMLAAFLRAAEGDTPPPGDVVLCLLSDEEGGGDDGARFVVDSHPELPAGVPSRSASSAASRSYGRSAEATKGLTRLSPLRLPPPLGRVVGRRARQATQSPPRTTVGHTVVAGLAADPCERWPRARSVSRAATASRD